MKHVLLISDDGLFRELEEAAACKDRLVEDVAAELLRLGIQASQDGAPRERRPSATWPPAAERRAHG